MLNPRNALRGIPPANMYKFPGGPPPEVLASLKRTGGEGRVAMYKENPALAAQMDLDSVIRRTAIPLIQRELAPGMPDWLADPVGMGFLRSSPIAKQYPALAKFLPESERFFEHVVLSLEKQDAVASFITGQLRRAKGKGEHLAAHMHSIGENRFTWATLHDERTKRIIMDARQAATFSELGEAPPDDWQRKLKMPFDWFYLEFTEPVNIGEQEYIPDTEETVGLRVGEDVVRAILVRKAASGAENILFSESREPDVFPGERATVMNEYSVTFFLTDSIGHHSRRGFVYDLTTGAAYTRIASMTTNQSMSAVKSQPVDATIFWDYDISQVPEDVMSRPDWFVPAGDPLGMEDRYIGWWERTVLSYSSLLSWTLTYMMSKGIEIAEERLPRAMRRREQKKDIPKPWHIVQVEPRLRTSGGDGEMEGQQRSAHNIRYDVIGHLRCIQRKNEDGTTSNSFVWVRPHQRGLANDIYVPKTSNFKGGKETHPVMNSYFPPQQ